MKKNRWLKVFISLFVCVLGISILVSRSRVKAEEIEYWDGIYIEGEGIVLTQEDIQNLTLEEIWEKGNFKVIDKETNQEVQAELEMSNLYYFRNYDINYNSIKDATKDGEIGFFTITASNKTNNNLKYAQQAKIVVLGDKVKNINEGVPNKGVSYVKVNADKFEFTYEEYLVIRNEFNEFFKMDPESLFETMAFFNGQIYYNRGKIGMLPYYYAMVDMTSSEFSGIDKAELFSNEGEKEFNKFMNLDYRGGTVKLTFQFDPQLYGNVNYNPSITITVLPGEVPKEEVKQTKPTAPSTGDNTNTSLMVLLLLVSGLLTMYAIKRKVKQ